MRFRVLGPVSVEGVPLSALMLRRLLAALLARANSALSADELVAALWGDAPPPAARKTLQVYVRRLRLALGDESIISEPAGYRMVVEPACIDAHEFARLTASGEYEQALDLWHGQAYEDVRDHPPVSDEARRLDEERLRVECLLAATRLAEGRHDDVIARLPRIIETHPFREDLRGHLMLALYRAGRQSESLDTYMSTRKLLAEELGVDPGPELQRLHTAILRRSASLDLASAKPFELPADIPGFVGRRSELAELSCMLDSSAPVVISAIAGSAGVGKTTLAVNWARQVADRFPDGQLYLNLNGFSTSPPMRPIEALASMLRSIGVAPEKVPVEEPEAAALFRSQMAGRRMLVLLDNAYSAEQVCPLLPGGSGTLVLVTSRNSLGGLVARFGARRLSLDVLSPEEAISLLTQLLGASRVSASPSAVADLARACAYLPLALRVAAASLLDRPHRSVASHVSALLSRGPLDALAIEDDPSTAVRAAFDQSYQDIPADVQRTFRLLGLIPGPDFTVEAVAALADLPLPDADRHLARLATAHLINQIGPDRYSFHDLLRAYAAERAGTNPTESDQATRRLYDWYLQHVYSAVDLLFPGYIRAPVPPASSPIPVDFGSRRDALAWLDAESVNLIFAIEQSAVAGREHFAALLAAGLRGHFVRRRHIQKWLNAAEVALEAAKRCGDQMIVATAHLTVAQGCQAAGRYELAGDHLERAVKASRDAGWREMEAACVGNMAGVLYEIGNMHDAENCVRRSLELKRAIGGGRSVPVALGNLGLIISRAGRLNEALEFTVQAIAASDAAGLVETRSACLADVGMIFMQLGRYEEAIDSFNSAVLVKRELGDLLGEALVLADAAEVHLVKGELGVARESLRLAEAIAADLKNPQLDTTIMIVRAALDASVGEQRSAIQKYLRIAEIGHGFPGARFPQALAGLGLAEAYLELGDPHAALAHATSSLQMARAAGFGVVEGRALTLLARVALASGDPARAHRLAGSAMMCHQETGYLRGMEDTCEMMAHLPM